jgi:hypothetical protein
VDKIPHFSEAYMSFSVRFHGTTRVMKHDKGHGKVECAIHLRAIQFLVRVVPRIERYFKLVIEDYPRALTKRMESSSAIH